MRTIIRTLTIVVAFTILGSSVPAGAAERAGQPSLRDRGTRAVLIVKRLVTRFFGITVNEEISTPKPTPSPGG